MFKRTCLIAAAVLAIAGCSATALSPQAAAVELSPNPAPKGCKYVGNITGNQGNFFTGSWTSNKNLEQGAVNDVKNQAANLGANYVQLITNRAGVTGAQGGQSQTNVTMSGNAYRCPNL